VTLLLRRSFREILTPTDPHEDPASGDGWKTTEKGDDAFTRNDDLAQQFLNHRRVLVCAPLTMDPEVFRPLVKHAAAEVLRDIDVCQLKMRFNMRDLVNIPPVYPPPRPVSNQSICLLPGCVGTFKHTIEGSCFYRHKTGPKHTAAVAHLQQILATWVPGHLPICRSPDRWLTIVQRL
jgi:hypothetical protein